MSDILTMIQQVPALVCAPDGAKLISERDADFFRLETRLAGQIIQKFVTYRRRLVILGDISGDVARSRALRDFVYETNRGAEVWFMKDMQALNERLA